MTTSKHRQQGSRLSRVVPWTRRPGETGRRGATRRTVLTGAAVVAVAVGVPVAGAQTRPKPSWRVKPTRTNTGVPEGWKPSRTLKGTGGKLVITEDDAVYEDVRFACAVDVHAAGVTFRRCEFVGDTSVHSYIGLLRFNDEKVRNALVEDCTIAPAVPSIWWNGITGHDFTARRCQIRDVQDCFEIFNVHDRDGSADVLIEGCWGGDFYFVSAPTGPEGIGWPSDRRTHNDWCQIQGGRNIHIHYNTMESFAGPHSLDLLGVLPESRQVLSNLMIKPDVGLIADLNIHDNWCSGGWFAFNLANRSSAPARALSPGGRSLGKIQANKFASGARSYTARGISMPPSVNVDTGDTPSAVNVWEGTDDAIKIYHNG